VVLPGHSSEQTGRPLPSMSDGRLSIRGEAGRRVADAVARGYLANGEHKLSSV
jgi:hypothetical protein